eukprot:TRINITY_DN9034_c0_g3_i1.p1 TRINITY_DN9034_c0_g3~~TRINITY_DN9034_c0_g3_i1.p1  ORF type:complete len:383 (+),score=85.86 TRINITY_DN9034_c0_g3_i1:61-1149(+)
MCIRDSKPMIFIGTLMTTILYVYTPYLTVVFPDLVICLCLTTIFASFVLQAPLVGDYIDGNYEGRAASILTLTLKLGAIAGETLQRNLLKVVKLSMIYQVFGGFLASDFLIAIFAIRPGKYHLNIPKQQPELIAPEQQQQSGSMLKDFIGGLKLARNPWVVICFLINLVSGIEAPINSTIFYLWVKSFYGDTDAEKTAANVRIASLVLYSQPASFIVLVGGNFAIDKISKFFFVLPAVLMHILGFLIQIIVENPESWLMDISQIMQGAAASAIAVSSAFIINRYTPGEHRGKAIGVLGTFMAVGGIVSNVLGGFLFDEQRNLPYIIFIVLATAIFAILVCLFLSYPLWKKKAEGSRENPAAE